MADLEPVFQKRLTWMEPKGFRKAELKGSWKSLLRIIGLTLGAVVVFIGIGHWLEPEANVAWKLWVAGGGIVVMCLVIWVGTRLMRITVAITDKAIVWELGDTPTVYRFRDIDRCEIGTASVGGKPVAVLVVNLKNGDTETFGIASSISAEVVRTTLQQRGVGIGEAGVVDLEVERGQ
jgi:hypothetical protein